MLKPIALSALVAATVAAPALAEDVRVSRPAVAASLHEGALDMVAYYTELEDGAYEVVATFAEAPGDDPKRVRFAMENGDSVEFAMPGHADTSYRFARQDDALTISAEPAPTASARAGTPEADRI